MTEERVDEKTLVKILRKELETIGIDISTADGRAEFRDVIDWARTNKKRSEKVRLYIILIIIGGVLSTAGSFVMEYFQNIFQK